MEQGAGKTETGERKTETKEGKTETGERKRNFEKRWGERERESKGDVVIQQNTLSCPEILKTIHRRC
jgi:hypothetical protein